MDPFTIVIVIVLTCLGLGCGIAIFAANKKLPAESEEMQRTGQVADALPGMNCGACGQPGCFAYAQALVADPETIQKTPCMTALKDPYCVAELENLLGVKLDTASMDKKAVVHCIGDSERLFEYEGVSTCKGAAQLAGGFKKCSFGCLGLNDCVRACPYGAISMDLDKDVAVVDHSKCIGCGLCFPECPHDIISLVPGSTAQYLGCSYTALKSIPGRERCKQACTKCRKCVKASPEQVTWDNARNLPVIEGAAVPEAVEACPVKVIVSIQK